MATLADLIRATIVRTKLPRSHVERRARALHSAGLVSTKNIVPLECARLLTALAAPQASKATAFTNQYAALERIRWHNQVADPDAPNPPQRAGDTIERLVASIWGGSREHVGKIVEIVTTSPEIVIYDERGYGDHFHPSGTLTESSGPIGVRSTMAIPGRVIAQIGADLGHKGCAYAV
jgi:hypothetical protein